jgi:uncharacterized membrane protein (Fun14 family)
MIIHPRSEGKQMSSEPLLSSIIPFAGSGIEGFFMGMFLRRVLKFFVIIIGSFLGAVFLVIQWMQARQYIRPLVRRALDAEENYNLLFIGPPASAKTLFLLGILDMRKDGVYFDGSNTTNRILDILEDKRTKVILLDEIDKMGRVFQNQLLGFMESGRWNLVDVERQRKQYHFKIGGAKVFATCNEINRLSKPLQSRFRKLILPRYTEPQFLDVSKSYPRLVAVLPGILELMYGRMRATSGM